MFTRRDFLLRTLQGSSLLAVGSVVPQFLVNTAAAAETGKDTVLVVVELTGGNDGLNTVIPYGDDLYHKARPSLRFKKDQVVRVDDYVGLNPALAPLRPMLDKGQLAILQGVGYPNPDRSHFESMDIWQSADPKRRVGTGWIGRSVPDLQDKGGNVPVMQLGPKGLPLALQGAPGGVVSLNNLQQFRLNLDSGDPNQRFTRKKLIEDLAHASAATDKNSLLPFVQRRQLQTYATLERLQEALKDAAVTNGPAAPAVPQPTEITDLNNIAFFAPNRLTQRMQLIANLIAKGFGTRVYYVALDGFDTHSAQAEEHRRLLAELSNAMAQLFNQLQSSGHDKRVLAMTFSEFGRRVQENGSHGTDHGAASCMFVAGPAVKGGAIGQHPSLKDLDFGDLKFHTDFRRVYATLLDQWLGCDSKIVLGDKWDHVDLLKAKS
jgi:uncharacterized protein (DUF1501 family)